MELDQIIEEAKRTRHLSQGAIAKAIGIHPTVMSQVLHRKRGLPAEAAIELGELIQRPAKEVWEAAKRWVKSAAIQMALIAVTSVTLFVTTPGNAVAAQEVTSAQLHPLEIMALLDALDSYAICVARLRPRSSVD